MKSYLDGDEKNVVVVHCKAGKGRTGLFVCALLLKLGICDSADEAIRRFAYARSTDGAATVENPSQVRYVGYVADVLANKLEKQYMIRYLDNEGEKYFVKRITISPSSVNGYTATLSLDFHTSIDGIVPKTHRQDVQTMYEPDSKIYIPACHDPFGFDVLLTLKRGRAKIRAQFNMQLLSASSGVQVNGKQLILTLSTD